MVSGCERIRPSGAADIFSGAFAKHIEQRNDVEHKRGEYDQPDGAVGYDHTGITSNEPRTGGTKLLPRKPTLGYEMAGSTGQTKHLGTEFVKCNPNRNFTMESIDHRFRK
ncbi:Uncharacterized protein XB17_02846 [Leptospira santarosai]|nr:Uncharacterized protein XB17_02846 [Leptospira santarosai]